MFNGQADAARGWLARVFKTASAPDRAAVIQTLEQNAAAIASHQARESDLHAQWLAILASYLAQHPEAKADVEALAATGAGTAGAQRIGTQVNLGSGTLVGRDNFGDINPVRGDR